MTSNTFAEEQNTATKSEKPKEQDVRPTTEQ